jgi:hypothetical protein
MKIRFNFFTSIPALILWVICIYKIYVDFDDHYIFTAVSHIILIAAAIAFSLFVFIGDHSQYKEEKGLLSFIPTGINVVCILTLMLTNYFLHQQDNTQTIIYGTTAGLWSNRMSLDLRKNNTYKLGTHTIHSASYVRGRYTKKDSVIYLENGIPAALISERLLLKTIPLPDSVIKRRRNSLLNLLTSNEPDTMPETFLFQVDKNGKILDSAKYFEVGIHF